MLSQTQAKVIWQKATSLIESALGSLLEEGDGWVDSIRLYSAIHVGSHWKIQDKRQIKNTHNTKNKHNSEKATMQITAKKTTPG